MIVRLISFTPEPDMKCGAIARTCYSREDVDSILKNDDEQLNEKVLKSVIKSGHTSVVEHVSFTFSVSEISRVLTHQLVRHRIASYTQQSQRYVEMSDWENVVPPSIMEQGGKPLEIYLNQIKTIYDAYSQLQSLGIPCEDARYILPNAACTNITVTMNARELLHFFSLRCCERAQWEIRELACTMLEKCRVVAPIIFENAGPPCTNGKCPEGKRTCGNPKSKA